MSETVVIAQGLGKAYRLGAKAPIYPTLRESLSQMVKAPFARLREQSEATEGGKDTFWALKDVSFEVKQGEVLGLIGRNGAGKSTLLKVLSRITEPTKGQAILRGRVASLLEVGTGFHPELTGRENIYLNGSILGMRKSEVDRKFDEIVAFSEVEQFLDTQVKRYSSGMYVRLAFAVAAHLDPEVLIVDEVLAVGDAQFQKKCLGKMQDVASKSGRTILFVSHNILAVQRLCTRALLLRDGQVVADDTPENVTKQYLSYLVERSDTAFTDNPERGGNGAVRMTAARLLDNNGNICKCVEAGLPAAIEIDYVNPTNARKAVAYMTVYNQLGIAATSLDMRISDGQEIEIGASGTFRCELPRLPLPPADYRVAMGISVDDGKMADLVPNGLTFSVSESSFYPTQRAPSLQWCAVMVDQQWSHHRPVSAPISL